MNEEIKKYFDKQGSPQNEILIKIRKMVQKIAPLATEGMSYGVPSFKLKGNLVLYAAFKEHIGIYPDPEIIKIFEKELEKYKTSKGAIKFMLKDPIPYKLIEKIVKYKYKKTIGKK